MAGKKAQVYMGVLAIALAVMLFLSYAGLRGEKGNPPGNWPVDFLQDNYLPARKAVLNNNIIAKNVGQEVARELASGGGFQTDSECGELEGVNLWNTPERWCYPLIDDAQKMAKEKLNQRLPGKNFSLQFKDTFFIGKGEGKEVKSDMGTYSYEDGFAVNLDYSFAEYAILLSRAQELVKICNSADDLAKCLKENKPSYWKFKLCKDEPVLVDRKVSFCVSSPNLYELPLGDEFVRNKVPVMYFFMLDFTATGIMPVSSIAVADAFDSYLISFLSTNADSYNIYVANDLGYTVKEGQPKNIFSRFFEDWKKYGITNIIDEPKICANQERELNTAYLCGSTIVYQLGKEGFMSEFDDYAFTVTSLFNGEESAVVLWETN